MTTRRVHKLTSRKKLEDALESQRLLIEDYKRDLQTCNLIKDLVVKELHEEIKQLKSIILEAR